MGEFSVMHLLVVAMLLLVFFGPSRLPSLGQSMGKAIRGFKDGLSDAGNANNTNATQTTQITQAAQTPAPQVMAGQTAPQQAAPVAQQATSQPSQTPLI